ncbi:MAG: tetratricopeptide repeat protein [Bacteroidales bacterium]|nr:tetratricopeptide repeat protein [Bacteroidales bacterium]
MKKSWFILVYGLFITLASCNKHLVNPVIKANVVKSIEKDKELEYIYALTEATKQNLLGNYQQAMALLHQCINDNPEGDAAMFELSKLYLRFQDKENAVLYAKKAIEFDSTNFWYLYNLSQMYLFFYENDKAITVYEKIVKLFPENYEIKYDLSLLYYDKKMYANALNILTELENIFGVNEDISLKKHQVYVHMNDFKNAESEVLHLIDLKPDEVKYYGILAELYSNNNMDEKADEFYKKIFDIDSTSGLANLSYAEYLFNKGEIDSSFVHFKKAFADNDIKIEYKLDLIFSLLNDEIHFKALHDNIYELILLLNSGNPQNEQVMAVLADYYSKNDMQDSVIITLKSLVELYPKNKRAWEQLFFNLNKQKRFNELDSLCSEAINVFPNEVRYYFYKALSEIQLKEYKNVISTLNEGLKFIPDDDIDMKIQFYTFLGDNYYRLGENAMSDSAFEKVLEYDPDNIIVLNNYSYYLSIRNEKLDKALEMSKIVNKLDPVSSTYLDTYAWVLYKMGRYKEAKKVIENSINNGGDKSPTIVEHYGDILYMNGEKENAVLIWKKAKRLGGDSKVLEKKIETQKLIENDK